MYSSAQSNLQSAQWLNGSNSDRPSFPALVSRRFKGQRAFQVFVMPRGMLFLELRHLAGQPSDGAKKAAIACGVMGGAIGGLVGGLIMASSAKGPDRNDNGYELMDEDELFDLAASRKRSFVAKNDDIRAVLIDAPSGWDRAFADRNLAGWITVKESTLGKVKMAIHDQSALSVAVDALPRRLGDRVRVNVELDINTTRFVRKRG
jgi:hypothetical protein